MIWYSVNIRCDEVLIIFVTSRDTKFPNNTNSKARAFQFKAARFAKLRLIFRIQQADKVVLVDFGEHRNNLDRRVSVL